MEVDMHGISQAVWQEERERINVYPVRPGHTSKVGLSVSLPMAELHNV
jgi:hypothetical protein